VCNAKREDKQKKRRRTNCQDTLFKEESKIKSVAVAVDSRPKYVVQMRLEEGGVRIHVDSEVQETEVCEMPTDRLGDRLIDRLIDNTVSLCLITYVSIAPSLAMLVVIKFGAGRRFGFTLAR
jgi:hypothetical protein